MKHLMRDMKKLQDAFGHPVRTEPLMSDDINDLLDDDIKLSFKRGLQERLMLRLRLVAEEFFELLDGAIGLNGHRDELYEDAKRNINLLLQKWDEDYDYNAVETADALTDLVVVIVGMGLELGMPLDVLWAEVHRSNMAKVCPDGEVKLREDGKVLKPDGWTPPRIAEALEQPSAAWAPDEREMLRNKDMDLGQKRRHPLKEATAQQFLKEVAKFDKPSVGAIGRAAEAVGIGHSHRVEVRVLLDGKVSESMSLAEVHTTTDDRGNVHIHCKLAAANLHRLDE